MVTVIASGIAVTAARSTLLVSPFFERLLAEGGCDVVVDRDAGILRDILFFVRYLELPHGDAGVTDAFLKDIGFYGLDSLLLKWMPQLRLRYNLLVMLPPFVAVRLSPQITLAAEAAAAPAGSVLRRPDARTLVQVTSGGLPRYVLLEGKLAQGAYTCWLKVKEEREVSDGQPTTRPHDTHRYLTRGEALARLVSLREKRVRETRVFVDLWVGGLTLVDEAGPLAQGLLDGQVCF